MQFLDKYFHRVGQVTSCNKTRMFVVIACAMCLSNYTELILF